MNPQGQKQPSSRSGTTSTSTMRTDPVCGADVKPGDEDTKQTTFRGQNYTFCGEACRQKFEENPEQYVKTKA
jgi:YHS domain-containing protein